MGCSRKITNVGLEFLTREFSHMEPNCRNKFVQWCAEIYEGFTVEHLYFAICVLAASAACVLNRFKTQRTHPSTRVDGINKRRRGPSILPS